ncbi:para-nitrobenzyl esterase [Leifsonia sp. AK011]|nr:para-nitrobenzyl esterase [Leifsonia sp. AK011]
MSDLLRTVAIAGEGILTVNVWTPENAASAPIVVWVHGGAFERGTSALPGYDGSTFARDGVVFVSLNYRLGAEGFSVLDGAPLNLGLRDAALALEWVHREAPAFGGDPSRITLMGESAGGAIVASLLSRPDSLALVSGAIIQSGPLDAPDTDHAGRVTRALAKHFGIAPTREAFLEVSPSELVKARTLMAANSSPLAGAPSHSVAVDSDSLPLSPRFALRDVAVPVLIGTNTDEYRLWLSPDTIASIGPVKGFIASLVARMPRRALREVRAALPHSSPGEVLGQVLTDRILRAPATDVANSRAAPTYLYEFAWRSPVRDLRAAHAVEMAFTFDGVDSADALALSGPGAPQQLATEMHDGWVRFITTGDPGWPAFDSVRLTRVYDTESRTLPQRRAGVVDALLTGV